nr:unnamed protein product [Callosobruchus chinensis]
MKDRSPFPTNTIVILLSFLPFFTDGQYSCFPKGLYSFFKGLIDYTANLAELWRIIPPHDHFTPEREDMTGF